MSKHDENTNEEAEKLAQVLKDIQSNQQDNAKLELEKLKEENVSLKDQLLRSAAEAENARKRSVKQIEDASKFAVNNFAKDLIDVLENLYLATDNISSHALEQDPILLSVYKGVEMTKSTLISVFNKHGIKRIFPEIGEGFDHNYHQAVSHIEHPELPANAVTNVMRAGYSLHDRLLKPAMVVVAKTAQE